MSMRNLQTSWQTAPKTQAANLAANQINASAQSLASMDKNKIQTTKTRGPDTNVFGDLLPGIMGAGGALVGAFGGPVGAMMGSQIGTALGAPIGKAFGGQNAQANSPYYQQGINGGIGMLSSIFPNWGQ